MSFLTAWTKYLDKCQDYELFGGSIDLLFEVSPPQWIFKIKKEWFEMLFAARDMPEGPITPNQIFGPNMAVRSSVFASGFRFNENLGPNGTDSHYLIGGETEFLRRVAQSGAKVLFAKAPRVEHIVRTYQLTSTYWASRAYQYGRGVAYQMCESGQAVAPHLSRPFMIDQLAGLRHFSPLPSQRLNTICTYHFKRGFKNEWAKRQTIRPN